MRGKLFTALTSALILSLLLASSCAPQQTLSLPELSENGSGIFLRSDFSEAHLLAYAYDQQNPLPPFTLAEGDRAHILDYLVPLSQLGLVPGPLKTAGSLEASRPFPGGYQAHELIPPNRWEERSPEEVASLLELFPLPDANQEACEAQGGCFKYLDGRSFCTLPCDVKAEPEAPKDPIEPARRKLSSCPEGWSTDHAHEDYLSHCAPPPLKTCRNGRIQYVGSASCEEVGSHCPPGRWPQDLPNDGVIYVDISSASDGQGSRRQPFRTLQLALEAAPERGATIVLAEGSYLANEQISKELTIRGVCSEKTVIQGQTTSLRIQSEVHLRDLQFDCRRPGVRCRAIEVESGSLNGQGLDFRVPVVQGSHTQVQLEQSRFSGRPATLRVNNNSQIRLKQVLFENTDGNALQILQKSTVSLEQVGFRGQGSSGASNALLYLGKEAQLTAQGLMFFEPRREAIRLESSATATINGAIMAQATGSTHFWWIRANEGSHLFLKNAFLTNHRGAGILLDGAEALLEHVLFDNYDGIALRTASDQTKLEARRVSFHDFKDIAISLETGRAHFEDLRIEDIDSTANDSVTTAILAKGSQLTIERARFKKIEGNGITALSFKEYRPQLTLKDLDFDTLRNHTGNDSIRASAPNYQGSAIMSKGGQVELERVEIRDIHGHGVFIEYTYDDPNYLNTVKDLDIFDSEGPGLTQIIGKLRGERLRIRKVNDWAAGVLGAKASLRDLEVHLVESQANREGRALYCGSIATVAENFFHGGLILNDFQASGANYAGIYMGQYCTLAMQRGLIENIEHGVEVSVGGFPLEQLESETVGYSEVNTVIKRP